MADGLSLYEQDFVRWSEEQAHALRAAGISGTNLPLDWDNLAEKIDGLGRSLRSELRNRLATIIEHLLKLGVSTAADPRGGWVETVMRERIEVESLLDESPSLRASLPDSLDRAERKARKLAEVSLPRHGEWSPAASRRFGETRFSNSDVLGPWLPDAVGSDRS
ncbi:DUF29 domain-containing protein [Enterovirga aerilata]|uniref:DUF29 domain-containing protein n=1 Tax=Enterovirga aerilata TaxID=2730920 RepID=A0A849IKW1_9HYPH|nr:DUF29 domain-containing protein [Enterovirga sp. DB1703]NNM74583.1 DUF29 domain-containing protein [Enterovirga sp. DB1703]